MFNYLSMVCLEILFSKKVASDANQSVDLHCKSGFYMMPAFTEKEFRIEYTYVFDIYENGLKHSLLNVFSFFKNYQS